MATSGDAATRYQAALNSYAACLNHVNNSLHEAAVAAFSTSDERLRLEAKVEGLPGYMRDGYLGQAQPLAISNLVNMLARTVKNPLVPDYVLFQWANQSTSQRVQREMLVRTVTGATDIPNITSPQEQSDRTATASRNQRVY